MSDPLGHHSGQFVNNYTKAENQKFTEQFGAITDGFATAMKSGKHASDEEVQALVKQHYEFCLQFWKPTLTSYKSLATSYILPSPYQEAYESVAIGLGKYHYDAIVIWADRNLTD